MYENIYFDLSQCFHGYASIGCILAVFCDFPCLQTENWSSSGFAAWFFGCRHILFALYSWLCCFCGYSGSSCSKLIIIGSLIWCFVWPCRLCYFWSYESGSSPRLVVASDSYRSSVGVFLDGYCLFGFILFYASFCLKWHKFLIHISF